MHRCLLLTDVLIRLWFSAVATPCPSGSFGANCFGVCHCLLGHEFCDLTDGRCKKGPCKPGWTNSPLCQTACPKGFFGMNCGLSCHCKKEEECSAINGHCASNECAKGWIGPSCRNRMPVLSEPPVVTSINRSQVTLVWAAYEHSSEYFSLSSYLVQMLNEADDDWIDVDSVSVSSDIEVYKITTPELKLNQNYMFRVTVVWLNSNKPLISEPGPQTDWVHIACQEPTGTVTSLNVGVINKRTDTLRISWNGPAADSGCERYDFLMINLTCSPKCEPVSHKVVLPSSSTFVVVSQRNRSSTTTATVKIQAFNNIGLGSRRVSTYRVRLLPNAHYYLADNISGLADNIGIKLGTSRVAAIEDASTSSTDVASTGEYVSNKLVVATNITVDIDNITEQEHNETEFNAARGAIDLGTSESFTGTELASHADHLFDVSSAPFNPSQKQQKRYQLLKRSQHMMSFREIPSEQSSDDSTGALKIEVIEVASKYAVDPSDSPGTTIDSGRSIVISNLKAGTLYQVDVSSTLLNSSGAVLVFSASHWTLLQSPSKLSPPQVVYIGNTTITLKANLPAGIVKRAFTNVGIAYGILVVVEADLNSGSRFKALTESSDVLVHDSVAVSSKDGQLKDFRSKGTLPYYVALEVAEGPPKDGVIVVGDGKVYGKQGEYYNVPLNPDARYWLWIGLASSFDGVIQLALTPLEYPIRTMGTMPLKMILAAEDAEGKGDAGGGGLDAGSVAAIVLAMILLFLIICLLAIWWFKYKEIVADPPTMTSISATPTYRPRKPSSELTDENLDKVFAEKTPEPVPVLVPVPAPVVEVQTERSKLQHSTFDPSFYVLKAKHPISVGKLRHYYETHLRPNSHYALQDEFRRLPDGFTDIANVANLPYNVSFNRSKTITPYDKNRVKLACQHPNDSTYINASYIRTIGYRSCIITQCPMASTANEFWRMVWELQVGTIVMLIESRESNGSEYYHYWPKKSNPIYYRDVKVQLMREDKLAHHEVREFRLSCSGEKVEVRRVIQWQYVQWRPGGIPDHPIPFLSMVAAIQEVHDPESGFVIHCLKGGGRSGIYAAVDALVNEGKHSGKVDVLECVTLLRLERVNLVKSLKQYRFVYHCLIEAFNCHETRTPVHRFHFMLANLLARNELNSLTRFEKEYSAVQLECHAVRPLLLTTSCGTRFSGAGTRFSSPDNRELEGTEGARRMSDGTRSYVILPSDKPATQATVQLDGCFTRDSFILSSPPDKARLDRFWEMINKNNASCIVMLNKAEDLPFAEYFLPDDGSSVHCGRYTVHCDSVLIHPNSSFYVHNLIIVNNNNNSNNSNCENAANSIRLYEFAKWPNSLEVPLVDAVLDLTINVSDWNHRVGGGRPAALFSIHGGDKARAALFSIIWMTIDPIQYDGVVDVYSAARYIYSYMPIAITSVEQYHFLYCVMEEHVIRIETKKWRPEKVSESALPSALLKPCTSDGNGEERLGSRKPGKRRKRLKRLSSDGYASQSLKIKKRDWKRVSVDVNASTDDSTSDYNRDMADIKGKLETSADFKSYSPTAAAEETNERWQSPDKTGEWAGRDVKKDISTDVEDASMLESKHGLHVSEALPTEEKKLEAASPAKKVEDDWKDCFAKQVLPPALKQVKPEAKTVSPKVVRYDPSDVLQFCSSDRKLRTQPEVKPPSLKSPVATKDLELTSTHVDFRERSAKIVQRQPSPAGTSSDELPPTPKKTPVTSPASRMTCKCKLVSSSTGSPRQLQCRCKLKCDSARSDVSDRQRPAFETGAINTPARLAAAEGMARSLRDKTESPDYEGSSKMRSSLRSESPSDEDRVKCPDRQLTRAEKGRMGLSLGRGKPGRRPMGASSSDEDSGAAGRRDQSPKRSGLKQPGALFKKTSSLERRIQRKSPPRIAKRSQRFDDKECRPVSPIKKPSGAKKDVNSRTSDDIDNFSRTIGPKLKPLQRKVVVGSQAEDVRGGRSPIRSTSQDDKFTRASCLKDGSVKGPQSRYATDVKTVSLAPSLEEEPESLRKKMPHNQDQIPPSHEPSGVSRRRKPPTVLSKQREISSPRSQFASEKRGRQTSPVNSASSPKSSLSPAQSPFSGNKSPRQWTSDQRRSRKSPSRDSASPKRSRLSSRSSSWDRSSGNYTPGEEKPVVETRTHRKVLRPASRPDQRQTARPLRKSCENKDKNQTIYAAKGPPPIDETNFHADIASSAEVGGKVLTSATTLSTKPEKNRIDGEGKPPSEHEMSQKPKRFQQIARANPSNVGCEIKQKITDAETPTVTGNIDEVHPTLKSSLSDLSIDTRLTVERPQAQMEQKDPKMQDPKSGTKPQVTSNELQGAKQVPQMYANENAPQYTIPATKDANTPSPKETATCPCSTMSATPPVEDLSFDELLEGLFYTSSVVSTKNVPAAKAARESCQAGLKSGPSKAVDSSTLSPENNAGIQSASPKSPASVTQAPGFTQAASSSASPAVRKGFHPSDINIPYIDDTDSGSAHDWLQK